MPFWVYMLRCSDGSYYVGHTDDLQKRLWEHEQGLGADWTRRRRPVELVWSAFGTSRDEVFEFERRIKPWSRAKKEALIAGDWALVGHFARPPHERGAAPGPRPSTSLGTSGVDDPTTSPSRVPGEVEGGRLENLAAPSPLIPSEGSPERRRGVEVRRTSLPTGPAPPARGRGAE